MLCFRCEHRAKFLEGGGQPRCECGDIEKSNIGCYMFKPCKPIIMEKQEGDPRPSHGGPLLGARMNAKGLDDNCVLALSKNGALIWRDKNV